MTNTRVQRFSRQALSIVCAVVLLPGAALIAQEPIAPPPSAPPAQAPAPLLSPQQLDNLVAPVALYPDALLSQVLVAATYPLEVVEAGQWLQQNPNLKGLELVNAVKQQSWDGSVQALVVFPDVLNRLTSDVRWTTDLGNAFLAQQADVMNAVQRLRAQAQANGKLNSNQQETVTTQTQGDQSAIQIQPANPDEVYVPEYNPEYIWGPPAWGDYPPLAYPGVDFGFGFYPGIYLGGFFGGFGFGGWGWWPNWFGCSIFQNAFFFSHWGFGHYGPGFRGGVWAHNPGHRLGVAYPNRALNNRFGATSRAGLGSRAYSGGPRSFGQSGFSARSAPESGQFRGSGAQSYNRGQAYGGGNSYRSTANRSYNYGGAGNAYRSSPSYNYGERSAAPSYRSSPSYNYGSRSAVPSYRSSPSFGGYRGSVGGGGFHGGGGGGGFHGGGGHR
jgi:hypothetical protein